MTQKGILKPEEWANPNKIKFNGEKCKILLLGSFRTKLQKYGIEGGRLTTFQFTMSQIMAGMSTYL